MTEAPVTAPSRLSRVPPHDNDVEANLLGAALISAVAAKVLAQETTPDDFYHPVHALLAATVCRLVEEGSPTDAGTVLADLRLRGQMDAAQVNLRGRGQLTAAEYLLHIQAGTPALTSAPKWASLITAYSRKRRVLTTAHSIAEAVYSGVDLGGLVAEMGHHVEDELAHHASTWEAVDLAAVLSGEDVQEQPTYMLRTDGEALLYPDKTHAFNAEPESGKSLLAQWIAVERLRAGQHVLYVDFEAGAIDVVSRLLDMGAEPAQILEQFHYVRPDDAIDAAAKLRISEMLRVWPITFSVIDGVAEALALSGWDENSNTDVISFFVALPRLISKEGVCVVVIDHVVKEKDNQGRYARGAGAKLAGVDGATFKLEVVKPFGRGLHGIARVVVTKDRHGWVRRVAAGGTLVAELHGVSDPVTGRLSIDLRPADSIDDKGNFRPTRIMEDVCRLLETAGEPKSGKWVEDNARYRRDHVRLALKALVTEQYVTTEAGPRRAVMYSVAHSFRAEPESRFGPEAPDDYHQEEWFE